jgi:glycosyltransferase involved in cell wall biosynthesis
VTAPPRAAPIRVVAVGQTPPPYGGQAVAIQSFVSGRYDGLEIHHVRMAFSREMGDVGKAQARKVLHLLGLIGRILWCRARTRATVLYFPPAGPDLVPIVRDVVVLLATRWAFRATVFHFHAGGLSEVWPRLPRPLRPLLRAAYGRPDLALQPSDLAPPDGRFLGARRTVVVPNGVPDVAGSSSARERGDGPAVLLYAGVLRESKGVLVLVEACRLLMLRGLDFRLRLMGAAESPQFAERLAGAVAHAGLDDRTVLLGPQVDEAKQAAFRATDVFCYPTFFESETFGLVVAEAMQFSLPVVATRWRGVPSVVADGESGLLVAPRDAAAFAGALEQLLRDPALARRLGRRGREIYLERFTEDRYRERLATALRSI